MSDDWITVSVPTSLSTVIVSTLTHQHAPHLPTNFMLLSDLVQRTRLEHGRYREGIVLCLLVTTDIVESM
jgi:hypothetical protein